MLLLVSQPKGHLESETVSGARGRVIFSASFLQRNFAFISQFWTSHSPAAFPVLRATQPASFPLWDIKMCFKVVPLTFLQFMWFVYKRLWNIKCSVCSKEEHCKKWKPASGVLHHLPSPLKSFTSAWTTPCMPLSYATHCKDLAAHCPGWKGFHPLRSVWFCSCKQWGARKGICSWHHGKS